MGANRAPHVPTEGAKRCRGRSQAAPMEAKRALDEPIWPPHAAKRTPKGAPRGIRDDALTLTLAYPCRVPFWHHFGFILGAIFGSILGPILGIFPLTLAPLEGVRFWVPFWGPLFEAEGAESIIFIILPACPAEPVLVMNGKRVYS